MICDKFNNMSFKFKLLTYTWKTFIYKRIINYLTYLFHVGLRNNEYSKILEKINKNMVMLAECIHNIYNNILRFTIIFWGLQQWERKYRKIQKYSNIMDKVIFYLMILKCIWDNTKLQQMNWIQIQKLKKIYQ